MATQMGAFPAGPFSFTMSLGHRGMLSRPVCKLVVDGTGSRLVEHSRRHGELVSSDARNPIVAPLLDFSWWGPAQWMVLLIAAIFKDQVKDLIQWLFGSVARRAGWGKKPDAESKNTAQAAIAGPVGKADDGSPGPQGTGGDPPSAAAGET